ncbi:hypothetical protein ARTHRO8AJ_140033 [Arthrobacter sp. 8AJ]|nr:hypothetical protein ARTHRO8AJ_140033 [Arthrobacter sp. 8AJ]
MMPILPTGRPTLSAIWGKGPALHPCPEGRPVTRRNRPGACNGGAKEIRTPDLFDANEALYQLSYSPGRIRALADCCPPVRDRCP